MLEIASQSLAMTDKLLNKEPTAMQTNLSIPRYGRWQGEFSAAAAIDRVRITAPSGKIVERPVFDHQPGAFRYDQHGYEDLAPVGEMVKLARYTPDEIGVYHYQAFSGGQAGEAGAFTCTPSDHPGYVEISRQDPRYFAFSNGQPYCAIGVNLCSPATYALPQGMEHFEVGFKSATLGLHEYRRWFRLMAASGGNFTRIWLSNSYLMAETEVAGEVNLLPFNRLDGLIALAREYGIRLKLCFDHFRTFGSQNPVHQSFFLRKLTDPQTGAKPASIDEWLASPRWQELWFKKAQAYLARYGGDPTVMAWELWNEMDCVEGRWELVREWTRTMLARIKAAEPSQLVVQSLGSFDEERKRAVQDDLKHMPEMDFQQVHRYLDQGAPWQISTLDPVAFSIDAVQATRRPDRPVLLAETGAVNDRHTGPFRYYRMDERGIIFHDTTFPAFFAGAAGTGHDWFWDSYVDQKNLWGQLKPLADLLQGVALDQEGFQVVDASTEQAWCLALKGRHTLLAWVRSRADTWDRVLRDEVEPQAMRVQVFALGIPEKVKETQFQSFWPEEDAGLGVKVEGGALKVDQLKCGAVVKVEY
jgi:hypothetical protein